MRYQGPECFEDPLVDLFDEVEPHLSRDGEPDVLVGNIGRLFSGDDNVVVRYDRKTGERIAQTFPPEPCLKTLADFVSVCEAANILPAGRVAKYFDGSDVIVISPVDLYLYVDGQDNEMFKPVIAQFRYDVLVEIAKWDLGDAEYRMEIQEVYYDSTPGFKFRGDVKFSEANTDYHYNKPAHNKYLAFSYSLAKNTFTNVEEMFTQEFARTLTRQKTYDLPDPQDIEQTQGPVCFKAVPAQLFENKYGLSLPYNNSLLAQRLKSLKSRISKQFYIVQSQN